MILEGAQCSVKYRGSWYKNCEAFSNTVFDVENGHVIYVNAYNEFLIHGGDRIFSTPYPRGIVLIRANAIIDDFEIYEYSEVKDRYKVCAICGKTENLQLVKHRDDEFWACPEHMYSCSVCGRATGLKWGHSSNREICEICLINFERCDWCGELTKKDEIEVDNRGVKLCRNCREGAEECDMCGAFTNYGDGVCRSCRYEIIRSYDYIPPEYVLHGEGTIFYGIELEVDKFETSTLRIATDFRKNFSKNETVFHITSDGSLYEGLEFVFHPRTLKSWKIFEKDFQMMINHVLEYGGRAFETNTCGLHVHRSRKDLSEIDICKIVTFLVRFKKENTEIAQRYSANYASFYYNDDIHENSCNLKYIYRRKDELGNEKYVVLNLCHENTIEFRLFKGTLKIPTILAYIEFCDATVEFVRGESMVSIVNHERSKIWKKFSCFVNSRKKYRNLKNLMERKGNLCV